jgi:predicted dinucleotide-binding enzyme
VVVLSVPWGVIDTALAAAGPLAGRIVVDTTNQFGPGGVLDLGHTAARHNADRMPGARYTKCFNTLTAGFQARAASRTGHARVVRWICGDDDQAEAILGRLVDDAGYVPVDLGGIDQCAVRSVPAPVSPPAQGSRPWAFRRGSRPRCAAPGPSAAPRGLAAR